MSNTGSIKVLVSSTSPAIQYEGDWVASTPTDRMKDITVFSGDPPFSDKLYGLAEGKKGTLRYNVTGATALRLYATIDVPPPPAGQLGFNSAWSNQCKIEPAGAMVYVESITLNAGYENRYMLCDIRNLSPTESYTFSYELNVTKGQPVWFDRLVIDPGATANLDNALIELNHRSLSIRYDKDWENDNNVAHKTKKMQSTMSLNFTGTSVSWYGAWMNSWGVLGSNAAWKIDDLAFQMFTIPTVDDKYKNYLIKDLLFKTPDLEPGNHKLEVTYSPDEESDHNRPLALQHLVIQNAPLPTGSPLTSALTSPTAGSGNVDPSVTGMPGTSSSPLSSKGAKIGLGIGISIAGLLILGALVLLWRKRKTARKDPNIAVSLERSDSSSEKEKA